MHGKYMPFSRARGISFLSCGIRNNCTDCPFPPTAWSLKCCYIKTLSHILYRLWFNCDQHADQKVILGINPYSGLNLRANSLAIYAFSILVNAFKLSGNMPFLRLVNHPWNLILIFLYYLSTTLLHLPK